MISVAKSRKRKVLAHSSVPQCEVLSLVGTVNYWKEYRGTRMGSFLDQHGIRLEAVSISDTGKICDAIRHSKCKVVMNEAWHIAPSVLREIAPLFPKVSFISMNHSSLVLTGVADRNIPWFNANHIDSIKIAREQPNCYYGTPMDTDHLPVPDGTKVISLPNVSEFPTELCETRRLDPTMPIRIGLIGRPTTAKNWLCHVSAIGEINRVVPVHVVCATNAPVTHLRDYTDLLDLNEVPWTFVGWQGRDPYMSMLANNLDLILHASLCESFGLVPLEAMMVGRPVVGSFAIEFLPDEWKANPQNPGNIADVALGILGDYEFHSRRAIARSIAVNDLNAESFLSNLSLFL